jgi:hypothetical protein
MTNKEEQMTDKEHYQSVSLRKSTYKKLQMISDLLLPNVKLSNAKANTLIINKVFDSLFSQVKRKETINAKST